MVGAVVAPSGVPVTWILCGPAATDDATLMVKTLDAPVNDGVTEGGLKDVQEIPDGRGVTHESATDCTVPAFKVAVIVTVLEVPC